MSSLINSPLARFLSEAPESQKADRTLALNILHRIRRVLHDFPKGERPIVVFSVYPTVATVSSHITLARMHPSCTDPLHPRQWTTEELLNDRRLTRLMNRFNEQTESSRRFILRLWWNDGVPPAGGFTRDSMAEQESRALGPYGRALREASTLRHAMGTAEPSQSRRARL